MRDGTRVVRTGLPAMAQGEPFLPGPTFAGPYHLTGNPSTSEYTYDRYHNPTWTSFEHALSELKVVLLSSLPLVWLLLWLSSAVHFAPATS